MARRIQRISEDGDVLIASAQTSLPFLPTEHGVVPALWQAKAGLVGAFDVGFFAADSTNITVAELFACVLHDGSIAADAVNTVVHASNSLTVTGHAVATGDGPIQLTTTDTLPTGLALLTDYYVSYVDANTIKLATTLALALAGTPDATFSDVGVGTHTLTGTASARLMHYESMRLLGLASDGAIVLTAKRGYVESAVPAVPRAVAYAVKATLSAAKATTVSLTPVVDR